MSCMKVHFKHIITKGPTDNLTLARLLMQISEILCNHDRFSYNRRKGNFTEVGNARSMFVL